MTTFNGTIGGGNSGAVVWPNRVAAVFSHPRRVSKPTANLDCLSNTPKFWNLLTYVNDVATDPALETFFGAVEDKTTFAFDWFEKFHVIPSQFIFGNVLSTQTIPVQVYSSYRLETHTWDNFINNAGAGVDLLGAPGLPAIFLPQTGTTGMTLQVGPSGPPVVDTTLDFIFDTMTISPVIQLERLVLFDIPPEMPYTEELEFLVQVLTHKDGSEQRIALRKNPRQFFEWDLQLQPGSERSRIHNLLFDWQSRVFGIPQWHEATFTTAAITAGALTFTVRSTDFADYRVGGLVLIYKDSLTYDVLEVDTAGIAPTTITVTNGTQNNYASGAMVMPLRSGVLRPSVSGSRFRTDLAKLLARFQVLDNDANLGSLAGWNTFNSKILLDDINSVEQSESMDEEFFVDMVGLDNGTGVPVFTSPWDKGKRASTKTFWTRTRTGIWSIRKLLHSLRGRQTSFYLPTFGKDLTPAAPLLNATNTITVENVGYAKYIRQRAPYNVIRVVFVNPATATLLRTVTASGELTPTTEQLTLSSNWPATYTVADVLRIEYVPLSRFDSDTFRIRYALGERTVRVTCPVVTVFDE